MTLSKKNREQAYLDRFREVCTDIPAGTLIPSEKPDFLIQHSEGTLGIEVTEIHSSVGLSEQQSLQKRVVDLASRKYDQSGGPAIWVSVHFNDNVLLTKNMCASLAEKLYQLALRNLPLDAGGHKEERYDYINREYFPEAFDDLHIRRYEPVGLSEWTIAGAIWLPSLDSARIQTDLDRKNDLHDSYKLRCDEVWLLLVASWHQFATTFHVDSSLQHKEFASSFNRVFILHTFRNLVELKVRSID